MPTPTLSTDPRQPTSLGQPAHPRVPEEALGRIAERLKALADPTRLRLLFELEEAEICVGELAGQVGGSQANVSKHLAVLRKAGLVSCRRDGMNVCYSIADPSAFEICRLVLGALAAQADQVAGELRAACDDAATSSAQH